MRLAALLIATILLQPRSGLAQQQLRQAGGFDHPQHARLFPSCETCHAGAATPGAPWWPQATSCIECHDGVVAGQVTWAPRVGAAPTNLRFDHERHRRALATSTAPGAAEPPSCITCHSRPGAPWMQVERAVIARCLDCHRSPMEHLAVPDTACASCHLSLAEAASLPPERVKNFAVPPSHRALGFMLRGPTGHGTLARPAAGLGVAASCATCHARDFCLNCHVNAPETPAIQALALDSRSLLHPARLRAPGSHAAVDFLRTHGATVGRNAENCVACHTRESCSTCHAARLPRGAGSLAAAGPGRSAGALTERKPPASHTPLFAEQHGTEASAAPATCASCHVRADCLDCHRPSGASAGGHHPAGFLASHPVQAYRRETSCADCHNQGQFCASCHAQSGLVSRGGGLWQGGRYHDAKQFFLLGHGQAARQNLESCVSCHVEKDCLSCHSANVGRRFSPHGPGFDPARLRRRNPELCTACHGLGIP